MRRIALAVPLLALGLATSYAKADDITIDVVVNSHEYLDGDTPAVGSYELTGQSTFIEYRLTSSTSGGQLDGVVTPGTSITFTEVFPPPALDEYLDFAYLGLVVTRDADDNIVDTSFVAAFVPGEAEGKIAGDYFSNSEAELVTAMSTTVDSQIFFDAADMLTLPILHGAIAIPELGRPGATLDLIAFIGGENGDLGVKIGEISVSAAPSPVPEPASLGLLALGSVVMLRRRARA